MKFSAILCFATYWNEFFKYKRAKENNLKLAEEYTNYSVAYNELFRHLSRQMTYSDVSQFVYAIVAQNKKEKLEEDMRVFHDYALSLY